MPAALQPKHVETATANDPTLPLVRKAVTTGDWTQLSGTTYKAVKEELWVVGQVVMRGARIVPDGPWQEISVDLLEISNGEHLLVVVDYYSRWLEAILLKKTDAQHVIKSMEAIFRTHGLPEALRSDNGPPFGPKEFEGFLEYG